MTSTRAWAIAARYGRVGKRQSSAAFVVLTLFAGCEAAAPPPPVVTRTTPWAFGGRPGVEVRSPHYLLRTTVGDRAMIERLLRVMETAYVQYAALVPPAVRDEPPLEIDFFARPEEWEAFTRRLTGPDAAVYLSVGPGGYAWGDRFVCWLFNENDLWGVAAHEGLHQYVARHLADRLPPALEEGLATTFETVAVTDRSVRIDRRVNARRQRGLADAVRGDALLPLDDLIRLNAGDVAGRDLGVREGFYGQCWALARFVLETPGPAAGLREMLLSLRDGRVEGVGRTADGTLYRPAAARPLLQRFIAPDWPAFRQAVADWARHHADAADDR